MIIYFYRKLFLLGGRQVFCNRKDCWTSSHLVFLLVCQANKESWTNYLVCYQCYLGPITLTFHLAKRLEDVVTAVLWIMCTIGGLGRYIGRYIDRYIGRLSTDYRPIAGRQSTDSRSTTDRQSADISPDSRSIVVSTDTVFHRRYSADT